MSKMLASALYAPLEKLINSLLAQDPAASNRLRELSERGAEPGQAVVAVTCTSPIRWELYVVIDAAGLQLRSVHEAPLDASVIASAGAFGKVMMADNPRTALFSPDITLSGDAQLVQELFETLRGLDFDWEHHLAPLAGDVLTQQFSSAMKSFRQWSDQTSSSMRDNVQEYLHEEARLLPQRDEVEEFYSGVDDLHLQLDRVHARMQRLLGDQ